ncbi:MAG: UDP-N-acetylmuramate dehydrogenase [Cellulosilyticaceae bacterium]
MDRDNIVALLKSQIPADCIRIDELMEKHTSFKIGGPADIFVSPNTVEQIIHVVNICKENNVPFYVIGNGSNLLVSDKGIRGVVIELFRNFASIEVDEKNKCITAQSGALLSRFANAALEVSLTGLEFAHGIPGALGGGVTMNAGAYGGEMKQVITKVTALDQEGNVLVLEKDALQMGYRTSIIQTKKYIVLDATAQLVQGDKTAIQERMKDLSFRRKDKQPLEYPSAGSTFKRPEGHFAGKLIMDCGLKGHQIGGAKVSDKHCGFIINADHATYEDVINLIEYVKLRVKEQFKVELEPEVRIIGER